MVFSQIDSSEVKDLKQRKEKLNEILFKEIPRVSPSETQKLINLYDNAEKLTTSKLGNYITYINNCRGHIYEETGDLKNALSNYNKAYKTAIDFGDSMGSARSLQCKAIYYGKRNLLDSSEYYITKSIAIAKNNLYNPIVDSTQNKVLLISLQSNLGLNLMLQEKYQKAITNYFETLELAKKLNDRKVELLTYGYIGSGFMKLENYKKALEYYTREMKLAKEVNDKIAEAYSLLHLADVFEEKEQWTKAKAYNLRSLRIFQEYKHKDGIINSKHALFTSFRRLEEFGECHKLEPELIKLYKEYKSDPSHLYIELGEIYSKEKQFDKAEKYFDLAEKILDSNHASKLYLYKKKAVLEQERGNLEKALSFKQKELDLSKKEIDSAYASKIALYETKFRTSEKEARIKNQQLLIEKQKNNTYKALLGIIITVLLSILAYLWIRVKQRQKQQLIEKQIEEFEYDISRLELSNINSQLNPHEVAGILQRVGFEVYSESSKAYDTVTTLHRIIRSSLTSVLTENLQLQLEQIETLLIFEKSKINTPFEFSIHNQIRDVEITVPKLLLVNLVNNAINHGIRKNHPYGGSIVVEMNEDSEYHYFVVEDTGKGMDTSKPLQKGIGLSSYEKLFFVLNKKNTLKASLEIIDKILQPGTIVKVTIPKNYQYPVNR
jgi:hypothetical protein